MGRDDNDIYFLKMLLAIDAGNTNIIFALFDGNTLRGKWRFSSNSQRTADEYALGLLQLMAMEKLHKQDITGAIISTVVPQALFSLKTLCRRYFNCEALVIGEKTVKLGVEVAVDRPSEVGADRLVNALAAYRIYGGDTIIIDFGTATTFDVVSAHGVYKGGVIAPGINLSVDALHAAAAKLPEVEIARPERVIGTNTVMAMQSGMYWGYVALIEGIVARIREEYGIPMKVIATGGLATLYAKATPVIEHLEEDLTIVGLRLMYKMNANVPV